MKKVASQSLVVAKASHRNPAPSGRIVENVDVGRKQPVKLTVCSVEVLGSCPETGLWEVVS